VHKESPFLLLYTVIGWAQVTLENYSEQLKVFDSQRKSLVSIPGSLDEGVEIESMGASQKTNIDLRRPVLLIYQIYRRLRSARVFSGASRLGNIVDLSWSHGAIR
jgi:hypothetical protein